MNWVVGIAERDGYGWTMYRLLHRHYGSWAKCDEEHYCSECNQQPDETQQFLIEQLVLRKGARPYKAMNRTAVTDTFAKEFYVEMIDIP